MVLYGVNLCDANNLTVTNDMLENSMPKRQCDGSIIVKLNDITFVDFYRLGQNGCEYKTWFSY